MTERGETTAFGRRLQKLRRERGWSLRELGRRAGISAPYLWQMEHNNVSPTLRVLLPLARALGVSVGALLVDDDEGVPPVSTRALSQEQNALKERRQALALGDAYVQSLAQLAGLPADGDRPRSVSQVLLAVAFADGWITGRRSVAQDGRTGGASND